MRFSQTLAVTAYLTFITGCLLRQVEASHAEDEFLAYRTPDGIEFSITAQGLSRIAFQDRELANGQWTAFNGESWFSPQASKDVVEIKTPLQTSLDIVSPVRASVQHTYPNATCVYDYTFAGEDLTISARIENHHQKASIDVIGFSGLTLAFDRPPTGLHHAMHPTYSQAHGIKICHPSAQNRIGGSYAIDDGFGIGLSPWRTGLARTLILLDYGSWATNKRDQDSTRKLLYFCASPVPPRGARTFDLRIRVSLDRSWQHLLQPYREHFRQTFGQLRYSPDFRWIATDYLNHSQSAISADNPYGLHGGHRRIDTPEGATAFCDTVIPHLTRYDGQGIIVWGQGGDDPRGCMYRPDFDILPPEVEAQWTGIIVPRFQAAGMRLGVTTRPRDMAVRRDWQSDQTIDINPDDPGHREMIWQRFENMINRGCTLFYLDSFGNSLEDVRLMRWLRERLGPDVRTYCEHQCDAIVPFSGGYSETTLHADTDDPHYRVWSGLETWEIYRWLCPGAELAARLYQRQGTPPDDFETVDQFFHRHSIIPLLPVNDLRRAEEIHSLWAR